DERSVVALAMLRAKARRAIGAAVGRKRRYMEGIDQLGRAHAQAHVGAAVVWDRRHRGTQVEPELGIFLAEADGVWSRLELGVADRAQHRFIEAHGPVEIAHGDGDVIDHCRPRVPGLQRTTPRRCGALRPGHKNYAGAFDLTSLYTIESINAWNEASMILGET